MLVSLRVAVVAMIALRFPIAAIPKQLNISAMWNLVVDHVGHTTTSIATSHAHGIFSQE